MDEFISKRIVVDVDVNKIKELCLNGKFTELSALGMLVADEEERKILSQNNETARKFYEKFEAMVNDDEFKKVLKVRQKIYKKKDKVLKEWALKSAKMMLENNIDLDIIAYDTELSIKEIEALK